MLEELKNLKTTPTKESIEFFLNNVISTNQNGIDGIKVLCSHAPGNLQLSANDLILYCYTFGWINCVGDKFFLSSALLPRLNESISLSKKLLDDTVNTEMFVYESSSNRIRFKNELLPLGFSSVRNVLISQGLFEIERLSQKTVFYLNQDYIAFIENSIIKQKRLFTLEQLKKKIEENEIAGDKAEKFVLNYEKNRLPEFLRDKIKIISSIDVSAGYDIISFNSENSTAIDRFIEVKAVGKNDSFYWSENEYETAKLLGSQYYLYLVDLSKIEFSGYIPLTISNPAVQIMDSTDWLVETQTYHIRHIPDN